VTKRRKFVPERNSTWNDSVYTWVTNWGGNVPITVQQFHAGHSNLTCRVT
jgi:hypothetical protein